MVSKMSPRTLFERNMPGNSVASTASCSSASPEHNSTTRKPGNRATHIVRVKIVGLDGIQYKKQNENVLPGVSSKNPKDLKAVVAIVREQNIQATTRPSEHLSAESRRIGRLLRRSKTEFPSRCSALWSASKGATLVFETALTKLVVTNESQSSAQYMPARFDLIAALTEDTPHQQKVALPVGLAEIVVSANDDGETVSMELPLRSLNHFSEPRGHTNGLHGFRMISIRNKKDKANKASRGKWPARWMNKIPDDESEKVPSVAHRKAFSSAYFLDEGCDGVLRVEVQVVPKRRRRALAEPEPSKGVSTSAPFQDSVEKPNGHYSNTVFSKRGTTSQAPRWTPPSLFDDVSAADSSKRTRTTGSADTLSSTSEISDSEYPTLTNATEREPRVVQTPPSSEFLSPWPNCGETILSEDFTDDSYDDSLTYGDSEHSTSALLQAGDEGDHDDDDDDDTDDLSAEDPFEGINDDNMMYALEHAAMACGILDSATPFSGRWSRSRRVVVDGEEDIALLDVSVPAPVSHLAGTTLGQCNHRVEQQATATSGILDSAMPLSGRCCRRAAVNGDDDTAMQDGPARNAHDFDGVEIPLQHAVISNGILDLAKPFSGRWSRRRRVVVDGDEAIALPDVPVKSTTGRCSVGVSEEHPVTGAVSDSAGAALGQGDCVVERKDIAVVQRPVPSGILDSPKPLSVRWSHPVLVDAECAIPDMVTVDNCFSTVPFGYRNAVGYKEDEERYKATDDNGKNRTTIYRRNPLIEIIPTVSSSSSSYCSTEEEA